MVSADTYLDRRDDNRLLGWITARTQSKRDDVTRFTKTSTRLATIGIDDRRIDTETNRKKLTVCKSTILYFNLALRYSGLMTSDITVHQSSKDGDGMQTH